MIGATTSLAETREPGQPIQPRSTRMPFERRTAACVMRVDDLMILRGVIEPDGLDHQGNGVLIPAATGILDDRWVDAPAVIIYFSGGQPAIARARATWSSGDGLRVSRLKATRDPILQTLPPGATLDDVMALFAPLADDRAHAAYRRVVGADLLLRSASCARRISHPGTLGEILSTLCMSDQLLLAVEGHDRLHGLQPVGPVGLTADVESQALGLRVSSDPSAIEALYAAPVACITGAINGELFGLRVKVESFCDREIDLRLSGLGQRNEIYAYDRRRASRYAALSGARVRLKAESGTTVYEGDLLDVSRQGLGIRLTGDTTIQPGTHLVIEAIHPRGRSFHLDGICVGLARRRHSSSRLSVVLLSDEGNQWRRLLRLTRS